MLYVYVVTFVLYPGVTLATQLDFLNSLKNETSWFILLMNTTFSIFDTFGRWLGGVQPRCDMDPLGIKLFTLGRTIFIPTSLFVALGVKGQIIFQTPYFILLNMCLFAFSNGYLTTLCAIKAP